MSQEMENARRLRWGNPESHLGPSGGEICHKKWEMRDASAGEPRVLPRAQRRGNMSQEMGKCVTPPLGKPRVSPRAQRRGNMSQEMGKCVTPPLGNPEFYLGPSGGEICHRKWGNA